MTSTSVLTILAIERLRVICVHYELCLVQPVQSSLSKALVESVTIRLQETKLKYQILALVQSTEGLLKYYIYGDLSLYVLPFCMI